MFNVADDKAQKIECSWWQGAEVRMFNVADDKVQKLECLM